VAIPTRRPSLTERWLAAQRVRLEGTRPSTPTGDRRGERALYRDVRGAFVVPTGRPAGMAQRTAFIDNEIAGAIGRGVDQVVLLGAGYDGRALRFAGTTRWFEVDHPLTQEDKQRRLHALGLHLGHVRHIGLDLMTGDLDAALDEAGHQSAVPSLFVCEGLFAALVLQAIASICETLRDRAPEGSVLASTYSVAPETGRRGAALRTVSDRLLGVMGERRHSAFLAGDAEKLMVVTGWRVARSERGPQGWFGRGSSLLVLAAEPSAGSVR
jgi:methyltransferase (TIGR00027 family)